MTLCNLCNNIPWETLPSIPPGLSYAVAQHPYIQRYYGWPDDCRGYLHHQSLEALRSSATVLNCDLCRLIIKQAESCQEAATMGSYGLPLWDCWIMKRQHGGDGFLVMSSMDDEYDEDEEDEEDGVGVAVVAAIGICVRDGDPLESIIHGRPVEQHGGTSTAMSRVRRWVTECDEHPSCNPGDTLLPSRVIDVGVSTNSSRVKLYETGPHEYGKYISLSYCWGKTPGYITKKATLEDRKRLIVISDLPKTHQDAIKLTQYLGIRYLWIDGICICQDDEKDWERESAKMVSIYRNAYLTISASSAKDSSQGLFGERPAREYVELDYIFGGLRGQAFAFALPLEEEVNRSLTICMFKEPLSNRAWTLQERAGSSRTVIYGTPQLFFECNKGFRGEDGLSVNDRFESIRKLEQKYEEVEQGDTDGKIPGNKLDLLRSWQKLVGLYKERQLTYASDKLPAISGLANFFAKWLDDEYVAGLWRSQLIEGLLWRGDPSKQAQQYRSPSWSWASTDGSIGLYIPQSYWKSYTTLAKVLDVYVDLKGANPYGEVLDASIKIQAPMERLYLTTKGPDPNEEFLPFGTNPKVNTAHGKPEGTYCHLDFHYSAEDNPQEAIKGTRSLEGVDIFALILVKVTPKYDGAPYEALIISKVKGAENYQRLGTIYLDEETLGRRPEEEAEEGFPIITLV